jgi:hypothetical protein
MGGILRDRDPLVNLGGRKKKKKLIFLYENTASSPHIIFFCMSMQRFAYISI